MQDAVVAPGSFEKKTKVLLNSDEADGGIFAETRKGSGESESEDDDDLELGDMMNGTGDTDIIAEIDNGSFHHVEGKGLVAEADAAAIYQAGISPQYPSVDKHGYGNGSYGSHHSNVPPPPPRVVTKGGNVRGSQRHLKEDEFVIKGSIDISHQHDNEFDVFTPNGDEDIIAEADEEIDNIEPPIEERKNNYDENDDEYLLNELDLSDSENRTKDHHSGDDDILTKGFIE